MSISQKQHKAEMYLLEDLIGFRPPPKFQKIYIIILILLHMFYKTIILFKIL